MKTKILLITGIVVILFTSQNMNAQFKYGIHAGASIETQAPLGQLWNNKEIYPGFQAGGFLNYSTGKILSLQTELNYQKKGDRMKSYSEGAEIITKRDFNYLSVPLFIKGTFGQELGLPERWSVSGFTGPYAGFLTSANSKVTSGGNTSTIAIDNQAEKNDWGIIFGGGVSYKLNGGSELTAELRYEMGCNKIDKLDPDIRNKVFGLTIGYCFR
jgi:hypothetical protein